MKQIYIKMSKWQDITFNIENKMLSDIHIYRALNSFWIKKVKKNKWGNRIVYKLNLRLN